jgi:hypothetical protein
VLAFLFWGRVAVVDEGASFTIDTNCLIDLAEPETRPNAIYVAQLVQAHSIGLVELACVGISASEKQLGGFYLPNFAMFKARLNDLGLGQIEILKPVGCWDVTYWDHFLYGDPNDQRQHVIHSILFPTHDFMLSDAELSSESGRKWRNRKCDVLGLWSHVNTNRTYFVTSDQNFHKKKAQLLTAGFGQIVSPHEACALL